MDRADFRSCGQTRIGTECGLINDVNSTPSNSFPQMKNDPATPSSSILFGQACPEPLGTLQAFTMID